MSAHNDRAQSPALSRRERRLLDRRALRLERELTGSRLPAAFDRRVHVLVAAEWAPRGEFIVDGRHTTIAMLRDAGYEQCALLLERTPDDPQAVHLVLVIDDRVSVVERIVHSLSKGGEA